ncbi:Protein of unknown function [Nonomuraea jiangxiensis]|uniref:DUF998 domain-containing protein n=2 Tax=Nonomuraea jiangxiensis TaxID=633440 RepID=A0A1G8XYI8_9ACTN|nr:Protein of unknown function [Nonomuraea jiangxiensis]
MPPGPDPRGPETAIDRTTRRLLLCGVVAGPLFVVAFLVQGALKAHYDPLRHPISSLALGPFGWVQTANFVIAGVLSLAFAAGMRRALRGSSSARGARWGPILVGAWGVMLVGAGVFTTDPVSGYPPGTPDQMAEYSSVPALLHDLLSMPGFAALACACVVFAVRFAGTRRLLWACYSAVSAGAFAVMLELSTLGFDQTASLVAYGGLFQRISVTMGWAWLTFLAAHLLRHQRDGHERGGHAAASG